MYYTPLLSDTYVGKVYLRDITDMRTGKNVANVFNGKKLPLKSQGLYAFSPLGDTLIQVSSSPSVLRSLG